MEAFSLQSVVATALLALNFPQKPMQEAEVHTYEIPAIAGLWRLEKQDDTGCLERYNFGKNGQLNTISGIEKTYGHYDYGMQNEGLPILVVHTIYDNNAPDCSGMQIDQSDSIFKTFVSLDSRENPTSMQWCNDEQGQNCPIVLQRILP